MKKVVLIFVFIFTLLTLFGLGYVQFSGNTLIGLTKGKELNLKTGDIIFQGNDLGQSKAVRLATKSDFSHVGIVFTEGNETFVFEAVQPVKVTPLNEWIKHGEKNEFEVLRLKKEINLAEKRTAFDSLKTKWTGLPYDILFAWSDNELYCSELVWKMYKEAYEIELCELKQMREFDLSHPYVKGILKQRYGSNIPLDQKVVAPQDIYESVLLEKVIL